MSSTKKSDVRCDVLLPNENKAEFLALVQQLSTRYPGEKPEQQTLVQRVAEACWRVLRARRLEAKFLARITKGAADPDEALIDLLTSKDSASYQKLLRHRAQVEQLWRQAVKDIERAQPRQPRTTSAPKEDDDDFCGDMDPQERAEAERWVEEQLARMRDRDSAAAEQRPTPAVCQTNGNLPL